MQLREISGDNGETQDLYLNPHAVIVSANNEATNASLQHGSALHLTLVSMAEQKSTAVSLK